MPPPVETDRPAPKPSWAVVGIFILLSFAALVYARGFLLPMTLALLLFFVFAVPCRFLSRAGLPDGLSAAVVTLALLVGIIAAVTTLAVPIASAVQNAPRILDALQEKMATLEGSVKEIRDAAKEVEEIAAPKSGDDSAAVVVPASGPGVLSGIATTTPAVIGQVVFTLVLLFFALASRKLLYKRTVESFPRFRDKRAALAALDEIERSLGVYLGSITVINALLGVAIGLAMWAWGMPSPELFGIAAFALNYVPYVGPIAGTLIATLVALVTFDGFAAPILVGVTYLGIISVEGQFVTPYFLSRRLRLNTVVVFVAVALFAWMWSAIGMVVAVPMLVVLNVICGYVPGMEGLGNFLSGDAPPAPEPDAAPAIPGPAEDAASADKAA
jgi:predicted PurR-regulated permease PerM